MSRFSRLSDWLAWQESLHPRAIDLSLERLHRTLQQLRWQRPACPIVTVGGTNGKGSSVALISRILANAGYRVGTFTSPHLIRYNERICLDGREVSDASLMAAFERIDAARGGQTLTFFEFNALAALLIFETAHLDAIVLEVGMGGRLDAVNAVDADVALVTSISLDHCDWLGADLDAIGREKAGIFRAGKPAVFGSRDMPASIAQVAAEIGAPLYRLGEAFDFDRDANRWSWHSAASQARFDDLPVPALPGAAQFDNASAVLQVLQLLSPRLPIPRAAIERGMSELQLAGRFQIVPGDKEWVLDVAHNPAAARTLAGQLRADDAPRAFAICGILGDKDVEGIARELRGCFAGWFIAGLPGARAIEPNELAARLAREGVQVAGVSATVQEACALADAAAAAGDRIVVFGSFLTVGPALEWLQSRRMAD